MAAYQPQPIDTSSVALPDSMHALRERLAANAHDIWATHRLADGWTWGPARNDVLKQNPCLVPYDELPESEKEYDRAMVDETLKAIVALGYRVVPAGD